MNRRSATSNVFPWHSATKRWRQWGTVTESRIQSLAGSSEELEAFEVCSLGSKWDQIKFAFLVIFPILLVTIPVAFIIGSYFHIKATVEEWDEARELGISLLLRIARAVFPVAIPFVAGAWWLRDLLAPHMPLRWYILARTSSGLWLLPTRDWVVVEPCVRPEEIVRLQEESVTVIQKERKHTKVTIDGERLRSGRIVRPAFVFGLSENDADSNLQLLTRSTA